jgi:hypothetical protein
MFRLLPLLVAVLALVALVGAPVLADKDNTKEGTVVSVADGKLTIHADGKDQVLTVGDKAKITCKGKACKLSDLKKGFKVKVTPKKGAETTAVRIEATPAKSK